MKNPISLIVAILLVAVIALTACSQQPAGDSSPSESQQSLLQDSIFDSAPATDGSTVGSTPTDGAGATEGSTATEASTAPDENTTTGGNNTTETTTQPTQVTTNPEEPDKSVDYVTFQAMTPTEQQKFQESFPSLADFFSWYNAAKEAYEQENPPIEVGGNGQVDMGQLGGTNG